MHRRNNPFPLSVGETVDIMMTPSNPGWATLENRHAPVGTGTITHISNTKVTILAQGQRSTYGTRESLENGYGPGYRNDGHYMIVIPPSTGLKPLTPPETSYPPEYQPLLDDTQAYGLLAVLVGAIIAVLCWYPVVEPPGYDYPTWVVVISHIAMGAAIIGAFVGALL